MCICGMRLRQIEIFYHVYRAGSISAAARELNVSQPSVSKVLRHAEDQLGIELFARRKGRLVPTPAADELFGEASDLYARLSIFNRSLENIRNRRGGHLRIGVLPSLSLSVGPELIAALRKTQPDYSFELTTLHSSELGPALREKRSDLCIGFSPITDPRIASTQVGDGGLVLVSKRSLVAAGERVDEHFLHGAEFIGLSDSGPLGALVSQHFEVHDIVPREVVTAHTYHVALALVRKEIGLTITDQYTAYSQLGAGLHRYPLRSMPRFPIHASLAADHPFPCLLETAIQLLGETLSKLDHGISGLQPPKV